MSVIDDLKNEIRNGEMSVYRLARTSGVNETAIFRFLSGKRDLRFRSVAKLCDTLGMRLLKSDETGDE